MRSRPRVVRPESEAALRLLRGTFTDYVHSDLSADVIGRISRTIRSVGSADLASERRQGCYLRMISTVEAYIDLVHAALLGEVLPGRSVTVDKLIEELNQRSRGWGDRGGILKSLHDVRLADCASWKLFETGTRVRNCIAHALGGVSPRQERDVQFASQLAQVGVDIRDAKLVLSRQSVEVAFDFCWDMVVEFDALVAARRPAESVL